MMKLCTLTSPKFWLRLKAFSLPGEFLSFDFLVLLFSSVSAGYFLACEFWWIDEINCPQLLVFNFLVTPSAWFVAASGSRESVNPSSISVHRKPCVPNTRGEKFRGSVGFGSFGPVSHALEILTITSKYVQTNNLGRKSWISSVFNKDDEGSFYWHVWCLICTMG